MASDIDLLHKMISDSSICNVQSQGRRQTLKLVETGVRQNTEYSVEIRNLPYDCIAIKSDHFKPSSDFFTREKGQRKRADYVVVAKYSGKNWIIFIELKKGKGDRSAIVQQLKGSQCLMEYCRALGREFWNQKSFLNYEKYHKRFVSIRCVSIAKSRTGQRRQKNQLHDSPENMLKLIGNSLVFKRLLY